MKPNYKATLNASFTGYIVQAIVNNFVPLLFVTFNTAYNIPYTKITFLITFNFLLQLGIDLASAFLLDKIGYRISAVLAHIFAAAGLISLTVLPELLSDHRGILPERPQGQDDEHTSFVLLLGKRRRRRPLNSVFHAVRNRKLEISRRHLGGDTRGKRRCIRKSASRKPLG